MNRPLQLVFFLTLAVFSRAADFGTPVAAIVTEDGSLGAADFKPKLVVGIWPDGRIIWSHDSTVGGTPYFTATLPQTRIAELLASIEARHVFGDRYLAQVNFGPDSAVTTIWVQAGNKHLKMQSWHEIYEANPNFVALSDGLTFLDGRTREDAIRADKKEYQRYREVWAQLRKTIVGLIPAEGKPYAEPIELKLPEIK